MGTHDLLAMPYIQRRIIVVRDDAPSNETPSRSFMPAVRLVASAVPAAGVALLGVELGVTLPDATQANVGVSASHERATGRSVLSTMRLKPTQPASVPPGLVWLPHEPLWQEVAQARLESGLDSFVLDVRSTDDYGVNASLKALVTKAGLEAGGAFVEHRNTVWRLQGTFS
jgi:hypothetical protein